jgi:large subunit ribosomal protein L6
MSRVGKQPIKIPSGVQVTIAGSHITVKGPKGNLVRDCHKEMQLKQEGDEITVSPNGTGNELRKFHGLTRSLINNMVVGVSTGFNKKLQLVGVGYRAQAKGKGVTLTLGYSHPVEFLPPEGIAVKTEGTTTLVVEGADKELVGQVAAKIRGFRAPEPYHGKGVRYADERIVTKVGKAAGKK